MQSARPCRAVDLWCLLIVITGMGRTAQSTAKQRAEKAPEVDAEDVEALLAASSHDGAAALRCVASVVDEGLAMVRAERALAVGSRLAGTRAYVCMRGAHGTYGHALRPGYRTRALQTLRKSRSRAGCLRVSVITLQR